ncbi:unnamed protein product [Miscanthus lutarioriparius]|uniref:DNA-directed RNA polymerase II protein n=1 Tax=Miscanthus lutarioriparius TaxID=422564 RepID=A0A811SM50_9POAL|nr:unnamed protein product [Miscanthus lutarioriparius]
MASRRGSSSCALCEGSNLPSCCAVCVNARLVEYHTRLRMMRSLRDSLHSRIAARLEAKSKTDEQRIWRASKAQDIMELRDRLTELKRKTAIDKTKVEQASSDLKAKTASLNLAFVTLKKRRADAVAMHTNAMKIAQMNLMATTSDCMKMQSKSVKQLCRLFPMRRVIKEGEKKDDYSGPYDSICGARLPRGLDPHSIPSEELSASLGYMLHFINIAVRSYPPSLHVSGFKGSCSNIWQRSSYWSTRQSQSKVYPLFVPRKNVCTGGEEASLTESGSSNFGVDSVDSVKKPSFDSKRSNSFSFSGASSHSMERHQYLQRGISLLKTSVTAITTYYYNSLGLDVPSNLSTFEAFAKLLHMLSSSKALRTAFESNIASSTLDNLLLNSNESFLYTGKLVKHGGVPDSIFDGWDLVEREVLPPPPSQVEDVAQWERAMYAGTKKK